MRSLTLIVLALFLSACSSIKNTYSEPAQPEQWLGTDSDTAIEQVDAENLKQWWLRFEDPALSELVNKLLQNNPNRNIALARIAEARGVRRSTRSALFPQLDFNANGSREDFGFVGPDEFFDARFDASFELDVFKRNQKNLDAADAQLLALENDYHDTTLSLIAEVTRTYIDYRGFEKQAAIAEKNLQLQNKTLSLIQNQKNLGEAPQLDVDRAENLVNTIKASIPEFKRSANNAKLALSVLTGELPQQLDALLSNQADIPGSDVTPVLLAPSKVLTLRPDIQAASATLAANTSLLESTTTELLPTFTLSGFFGASEGAFSSATSIWNLAIGTAVNLIDFGRIEGRIDAAQAREKIAYEQYRLTILEAVTEVETALNDYARINEQRVSLQKAYENADSALSLSETLYREGEVSFLDVLDAQRTVNEADASLVDSEIALAESLTRLYKSLGTY